MILVIGDGDWVGHWAQQKNAKKRRAPPRDGGVLSLGGLMWRNGTVDPREVQYVLILASSSNYLPNQSHTLKY